MELKLTKPFMHGPAVVRLQEFGDLLGYDYGPNDGVFGPTTENVVKDLQLELGLPVTGICDSLTWDTILKHLDKEHSPSNIDVVFNLDHAAPKLYERPRTWESIKGVTLHQTGCRMPQDPYKWTNLNAHMGITSGGTVVLCNLFTDFIWHAQGLSLKTIGIEIAGNFAGVEGDDGTLWKGGGPAAVLSDVQIEGVNRALTFIQQQLSDRGVPWEVIYAHRQSSKTRHGDPGSAIWQKIALPWGEKLQLHMFSLGQYVSGMGRVIPSSWDPKCPAKYWS